MQDGKLLDVTRQTKNVQLAEKKCPVGKKYVSSWRIIFSQLETLF